MKTRCIQVIKNRGGRAYIFNFSGKFRIAFLLRNEDFTHCKIRFHTKKRAEQFAREHLNSHRILMALERRQEQPLSSPPTIYPVYRWEYFHQRISGHDGLYLSYWYKLGSGRAFASTYCTRSDKWG